MAHHTAADGRHNNKRQRREEKTEEHQNTSVVTLLEALATTCAPDDVAIDTGDRVVIKKALQSWLNRNTAVENAEMLKAVLAKNHAVPNQFIQWLPKQVHWVRDDRCGELDRDSLVAHCKLILAGVIALEVDAEHRDATSLGISYKKKDGQPVKHNVAFNGLFQDQGVYTPCFPAEHGTLLCRMFEDSPLLTDIYSELPSSTLSVADIYHALVSIVKVIRSEKPCGTYF